MTTVGYKLLTPGPLTTTASVKEEMLVDHCTWDDDYKQITQDIRDRLLDLAHVSASDYTCILMQGSGTFGVESVLSSAIAPEDTLLVLANGAYGERMVKIADVHKIRTVIHHTPYDQTPDVVAVEQLLVAHPEITHVAMIHSETTTGALNNIAQIAPLCKQYDKTFIVDAMSSFGGVDIDVADLGIDFLVSSANKCIQGVPGFSFIIAKRTAFEASRGNARTLSLDLHDQWDTMDRDGKWRFTSPTHVVLAFRQALREMADEGVAARHERYAGNMRLLRELFAEIGLRPYLAEEVQGPIIATFSYPSGDFDFKEMYDFVKKRGYAIYPGKLNNMDTFRIGVIGEIYPEDIEKLAAILAEYLQKTPSAA